MGGLIHLLDHDPALGERLGPADFALARANAIASTVEAPRGPWHAVPDDIDDQGFVGMVVLSGCLTRTVVVDTVRSTELLGPGDVLTPEAVPHELFPAQAYWIVRSDRVRLAVLDRNITRLSMRWPELGSQIFARLVVRADALAMQMALSTLRGTDVRIVRLLWLYAERHGRVGPDGVRVALPLTHQLLAELIGTRRPAVTLALRQLAHDGRVLRLDDGPGFLLTGEPPAPGAAVGAQAT